MSVFEFYMDGLQIQRMVKGQSRTQLLSRMGQPVAQRDDGSEATWHCGRVQLVVTFEKDVAIGADIRAVQSD